MDNKNKEKNMLQIWIALITLILGVSFGLIESSNYEFNVWKYEMTFLLLDILDYIGNMLFLFMIMFLFFNKSVIVRMTYLLVLALILWTSLAVSENVVEYFYDYKGGCQPYFPHPLVGWSKSLLSSTLIVFSIIALEKKFRIHFFFKEIFLVLFMAFYIEFLLKWMYMFELYIFAITRLYYEIPLSRDEMFFYINFLVLLWAFKSQEKKL